MTALWCWQNWPPRAAAPVAQQHKPALANVSRPAVQCASVLWTCQYALRHALSGLPCALVASGLLLASCWQALYRGPFETQCAMLSRTASSAAWRKHLIQLHTVSVTRAAAEPMHHVLCLQQVPITVVSRMLPSACFRAWLYQERHQRIMWRRYCDC